jgi:hypothetical protein
VGSIAHRHEAESPPTPGALARVRVLVSRTSSLTRPHPPRSQAHRDFTAQQLIRDALAVWEPLSDPRAVPGFRCTFCAGMPPPSTTGSSTSLSSRTTTSTRPSSRVERLGTPKIPAIRFTRAMNFVASWFTHLLRPASLLALLYGSDQLTPAIEGFYIQHLGTSVTLPTAGYDYKSDWTPLLTGHAPARMATSLAAPTPPTGVARPSKMTRSSASEFCQQKGRGSIQVNARSRWMF